MGQHQREELARICRCQAALSSAPEVRSLLIELAERYEREEELEPVSPEGEVPLPAAPDIPTGN